MQRNPETQSFSVGSSTYTIAPEDGFRLMQWSVHTATGIRQILHWPETDSGTPFHQIRGGNPILFPFSGRSYDRGRENAWRDPDGRQRPMPRHGFARDGRFSILTTNDTGITAQLIPSEAAQQAYPFDYSFTASYTFEELSLTVTLSLDNKGSASIPWSAGHHFYFNLPWHKAATRRDYRLNMESRKCAYHGPDGKLVMEHCREACHEFSDPALLDRIHWELRHNRVSFGPRGGEEDTHLVVGGESVPQKGYSIVTWTESESAPFYCIEPWMGPPNAAEHGKGLHWVGPGETAAFTVQVSLY